MRRTRVLGAAAAGLVGLTVAGALILPGQLQRRIEGWLDEQLAASVDADVAIGAVHVYLWSSFPQVTVALGDVVVTGHGPFAGIELARVPEAEIRVDLASALTGSTVTVEELVARGAKVHIVVAEDGKANWDVLAKGDATESDPYHLRLSRVDIVDLDVVYEDRAAYLETEIEDIDVDARADLTQALIKVDSRGTIDALTMRYGGVTWLRATKWRSNMHVQIDQEDGAIRFGENELVINALPLAFSGRVIPLDDAWDLDVAFKSTDTSFASLLSLVPDAYSDSFSDVDAAGEVSFSGSTKGLYTSDSDELPSFDLGVDIDKGRFKLAGVPGSVDRVGARIKIVHPGGPMDLIEVDAQEIELTAAGSTLKGRLSLTQPMSDPDVDMRFDGRLDLAAVQAALPTSEGVDGLAGVLDLAFGLKGRASQVERGRYKAVKADGTVRGQGLRFRYDDQDVRLDRLDLALSPSTVDVKALDARYLGSDVALAGKVDNPLAYFLAEAPLVGSLTLVSDRLDLRPFQAEDPESAGEADATALVVVPEDLDLRLDLNIQTLLSDELTLRRVTGAVAVKDGTARLEGVRGDALGGTVGIDGSYRASSTEKAHIDLALRATRLGLSETLSTFETLAQIAPVLERAEGAFDGGFTLATELGRDGSPNLSLLSSIGALSPIGLSLKAETLDSLAGQLKDDRLRTLQIAGSQVAYAMEKGKVELKPFSVKLGPQPATVSGGFGPLDKKLDLAIDLPVDTSKLAGSPLIAGLGSTLPKTADVQVSILGTYNKPKLKLSVAGSVVEDVVDAALDPLVAAATAQGDKLLDEARKAADMVLAEARKAADKVLDLAADQARKLKKEAKGKPVQELAANKAADVLVKEADKSASKILKEADKAADKLVADARVKKDQLIDDARGKAAGAVSGGAQRR